MALPKATKRTKESPKATERIMALPKATKRTKNLPFATKSSAKKTNALPIRIVSRDSSEFEELLDRIDETTHNRLCRGEVLHSYLTKVRPRIAKLVVSEDDGVINAYAALKQTAKAWEVAIICSAPGHGKKLLMYIIEQARASNVSRLTLWALPSVINFYRNVAQFKVGSACKEAPALTEIVDKEKQKQFATVAEAEADSGFAKVLKALIQAGHSQKGCKGISDCESYRMTLCLGK
jgi:N-acetylglutamate synthase-like GNAT family acetyltransferase